MRAAFRAVGAVAPAVAARWAETLFCTPPRHRGGDERSLGDAIPFTLPSQGQQLAGWIWGEGPTVVLVHGWGSRAGWSECCCIASRTWLFFPNATHCRGRRKLHWPRSMANA